MHGGADGSGAPSGSRNGNYKLRNPARCPHSKTKSSADFLKDLPCIAAVLAVGNVGERARRG
jgi:hypothetical protein